MLTIEIMKIASRSSQLGSRYVHTGLTCTLKTKPLDGKVDFELERHSNASEYWWGSKNLLHNLNRVRVPFIKNGIRAARIHCVTGRPDVACLNGIKILDVGCGGGILSEALARLGADVTGLDINGELIKVAEEHKALDCSIQNNLRYVRTTIHSHEKDNLEKYNVVVVSEVIEHVSNKDKFLSSCINTLEPGGSLFVTCPNKTFFARVFGIQLAEALHVVPKGTHNYDKFITYTDLAERLKKLRCGVRSIEGILYNPITREFSMSKTKMLMYAIHAIKLPERRISLIQ